MPSVNKIAFGLFGLNLMLVLIISFNQMSTLPESTSRMMTSFDDFKSDDGVYRFEDPDVAYNVLSQLDVFNAVGDDEVKGANYKAKVMKLIPDFEYCDKHRAYIVENPEVIFKNDINFITNFAFGHKLMWQVIPKVGKDITPRNKQDPNAMFDMPLNTNIFYIFNLFYYSRQVGKQYSCLSQASNHIAGHDNLYRKDLAAQSLVKYASAFEDRPDCFGFDKYFPKTWVLQDEQQCKDFFDEFLSETYQDMKRERNVVYFRKIGKDVHEGKGVFPVNDAEERYIQHLYKNGSACGKIKDNNLIQYNVHNLLLVNNRKFGFRSFLLVASTNPFMAYYHDGYARLSLKAYDTKSNETSTFVTNIGVSLAHTEFGNWTEKQIQDYTYWPLEKFSEHLLEIGAVDDPEWLDNHLRREFMKVKVHLIRMAGSTFSRRSSLFELYGLDYVMDENFNLWFIEANTMPLVDGFTDHSTILMNNMLWDTFDIVQGLIKSRMKRAIYYINNLVSKYGEEIPNLEERKEEFRKLTMNRFEPEFTPRANNTWYPIIDENREGTETYFGLLDKECLNF